MIGMKNSVANLFRDPGRLLLLLPLLAWTGCTTIAQGQIPTYARSSDVSAIKGNRDPFWLAAVSGASMPSSSI
jgi:hypothetical protein